MENDCDHQNFHAEVKVGRISKGEGGPITHYVADVRVTCTVCNLPFEFVGVPTGFAFSGPHCSPDLQELRAPLRPAGASIVEEEAMPGFRIRSAGN
jgi:hypothetical protein